MSLTRQCTKCSYKEPLYRLQHLYTKNIHFLIPPAVDSLAIQEPKDVFLACSQACVPTAVFLFF